MEPVFSAGFPSAKFTICALWDNSVDGPVPVGGLGLGVIVPAFFFVTSVNFEVMVAPVAAGASLAATVSEDGDVTPLAAVSGAPWSTLGMKSGSNINAGAINVAKTVQGLGTVPKNLTAKEFQLQATVLTTSAGRIAFWLEGHISTASAQGTS